MASRALLDALDLVRPERHRRGNRHAGRMEGRPSWPGGADEGQLGRVLCQEHQDYLWVWDCAVEAGLWQTRAGLESSVLLRVWSIAYETRRSQ